MTFLPFPLWPWQLSPFRDCEASTLICIPCEIGNVSSLTVAKPAMGMGGKGHSAFEQLQLPHLQVCAILPSS